MALLFMSTILLAQGDAIILTPKEVTGARLKPFVERLIKYNVTLNSDGNLECKSSVKSDRHYFDKELGICFYPENQMIFFISILPKPKELPRSNIIDMKLVNNAFNKPCAFQVFTDDAGDSYMKYCIFYGGGLNLTNFGIALQTFVNFDEAWKENTLRSMRTMPKRIK